MDVYLIAPLLPSFDVVAGEDYGIRCRRKGYASIRRSALSGADDFVSIARWTEMRKEWLAKFLDVSAGAPSHDRFNAVLGALKPAEFERCLLSWVTALHEITDGQVIAIDGKTLSKLSEMNRGQAAKLVGLAPVNRDSGSLRGKRMIGSGRATVRRSLYMATLVATQHNRLIRDHYRQLLQRGKAKMTALVARMRKLLLILNAMIKSQRPWNGATAS